MNGRETKGETPRHEMGVRCDALKKVYKRDKKGGAQVRGARAQKRGKNTSSLKKREGLLAGREEPHTKGR